MPNPFPGMNPYLEDPEIWPGFHDALIAIMSRQLNTLLPDNYAARNGIRVYLEPINRQIVPDIFFVKKPAPRRTSQTGGTAMLEPDSTPEIITVPALELREPFIEVRATKHGKQSLVVTVIELLSPANKTKGHGREEYQRKQKSVLESNANLLEIDLLRRGRYTLAVPQSGVEAVGPYHYLACLHRAAAPDSYEVWRIGLDDPLPYLRVPLAEGDPDILLDMQTAFNQTYEEYRYGFDIDYTLPPVPELEGDDAVWAENLLREKGLRTEAA